MCGKWENKQFFDLSENIGFQKLNDNNYGLKCNISLDENVVNLGNYYIYLFPLNFNFWTLQCSEVIQNV